MRKVRLVTAAIVLAGALTGAIARAAAPEEIVAPVPAGRLADALLALASAANANIAFDAEQIGGLLTDGLDAPATLTEALHALLDGTGLTFTLTSSGEITISALPQPPVTPTASPSRPPEAPPPDRVRVVGYREALTRADLRARRYDALVEIVSADTVGKLPDGNIADALDRLPAAYRITDQGEGRYISVRGVGQVFNTVTLNGITIAASDTDGRSGRAAPLDVLSASAVAEVEVHKVITPDRDSNAIGGLINVRTPSAHDFDERLASLTAEVGAGDFGSGRNIHAVRGAFSDVFGTNKAFGIYIGGEYWVREYLSHLYENPEVAPADTGVAGLFPDRVRFGSAAGRRDRISLTAALDWRSQNGNALWARVFATDYTDEELRPEFTLYRRGVLSAPTLDSFSWEGLQVRNETRLERQERPVRQYVLGGRLAFGHGWTLEGVLNETTAEELNPFQAYYEAHGQMDGAGADLALFDLSPEGIAIPEGPFVAPDGLSMFDVAFHEVWRLRRVTSEVREEVRTQQADLRHTGELRGYATSMQLGVKRLERVKSVSDADHRYLFNGSASLADSGLGERLSTVSWGEPYAVIPGLDLPVPSPDGFEHLVAAHPELFELDAADSLANSVEDDYLLRETILAGYVMGSLDLTPALRVTVGARIEHTDLSASANAFVREVSATGFNPEADPVTALPLAEADILPLQGGHRYTNVSPAVLAKWDDGGAWVLRAALTHTFARPDYVDIAPISTLSVFLERDPATGVTTLRGENRIGNPMLRPTASRNWDLSAQYRLPGDSGWLSVMGFYKSVDGLVYRVEEDHADITFAGVLFDTYRVSTPRNVGEGHLAGLELAIRYDFLNAPPPFDGFGVLANAAFIDSHISTPSHAEPLSFLNQADLIYTLQLHYERKNLQARIAFAHQNAALLTNPRSNPGVGIYRAPQSRLDAKIILDLDDSWSASLTGANLNNSADRTVRTAAPRTIAEDPGYEIYGREFRLSVTRRW